MAGILGLPRGSGAALTLLFNHWLKLGVEQPDTEHSMRLPLALAFVIATTSAALAEGFEVVIPGRPGVPIVINGIDVSYAVVEGDFGLGKGYTPPLTIYGGRVVEPAPEV